MVNASLNWASIIGLVLILSWIPLIVLTITSITRLSSSSPDFPFRLINLLGLLGIPPICGLILFFQGWRLDPILQFGQFLLVFQLITQQLVLIVIHKKNNTYSRNNSFKDIQSQLEGYLEMKNKNLITEDEFISKKKQILNI